MQVGDTIRRTTLWGDVVQKTIHDIDDLKSQKKMLNEGTADFEVLKNGKWEFVPKLMIHQREVPESCESCSA